MNHIIVLFKNKEKKKIINKFITLKKAKSKYKELLKISDEVIFEKKTENGFPCEFELGLLKLSTEKEQKVYLKDSLGRNIEVELDDENLTVLSMEKYKIEETFLDYKTKKKIDTKMLIDKYLKGSGLKQVSKLNNKIVVQNDEKINLFTLKSEEDALRFTESLLNKLIEVNKKDCLVINDFNTIQRKYLYDLLENYGFSKSYLQTYSTTHPSKK